MDALLHQNSSDELKCGEKPSVMAQLKSAYTIIKEVDDNFKDGRGRQTRLARCKIALVLDITRGKIL